MKRPVSSWFESQKPTTLLVIRLLLVANAGVLGVVGGLYVAFAARPGGLVVGGSIWLLAVFLLSLVRYTNRRSGDSRW